MFPLESPRRKPWIKMPFASLMRQSTIWSMYLPPSKYSTIVWIAISILCEASNAIILFLQYSREFQHENLLKLYGICSQGPELYIVTELLSRGIECLSCVFHIPMHTCVLSPDGEWVSPQYTVTALDRYCNTQVAWMSISMGIAWLWRRLRCFLIWQTKCALPWSSWRPKGLFTKMW